jgi:hypothetical protein
MGQARVKLSNVRRRRGAWLLSAGPLILLLAAASCESEFSGASPPAAGAAAGETENPQAGTTASGAAAGGQSAGGQSAGGQSAGGSGATSGDAGGGVGGEAAQIGGADPGPSDCMADRADCNHDATDGCETQLGTSTDCGGCAQACDGELLPYCAKVESKHVCTNPAVGLSGARLQLACVENDVSLPELCGSVADRQTKCPTGGKVIERVLTLGGAPGTLYNVTLRVRGVVEPRTYVGGKDAGDHVYIGGTGQLPSNYDTFSITVSAPAQTFFLNADAKPESHRVFTLDHQKTIIVEGGAKVTLRVIDPDCAMVKNCQSFTTAACSPYVIADVPPAPKGFDGQFVQLDVLKVATVH